MNAKDHQARAFALAIAAIRSDAETLDDAPLYCDLSDRKTYRHVDHLPRKEYRLPTPGNPRGMIVSAPAARDSLTALADKLEKGARAFGGTPPKRERSPLNTRGIVAARNAHAEGHRNAAHRALGERLFIAASGHPFAVVSRMQAAGHDILLCRSIAARSNTIIAFCARSGVRLATAGQTSGSAPAEFNDFCAWLESKSAVYSGKLGSMDSLDQAAAVADYLAGDTVEVIDPDAEPCDTAAAVARAEASAAPEPEPVRAEYSGNKGGSRLVDGVDAYHYVDGRLGMTSAGSFTRDMTRWITFDRADVERMGDTIRPYGATKNGVFIPATKPAVDAKSTIAHVDSAKPEPEPEPEPEPGPCDATDTPADPSETSTPTSADACKAGDTAGEKLASPQAVTPGARLFQPPARMVVPRGQIRAAKVKVKMPCAPPSDETQATSRSRPRSCETSRRRQSCRYTMERRKALSLPPRRSIPLRTRRRCARRSRVPPRNARAEDAPHYIAADTKPPPSLPAKRWSLTASGPSWQSWHPCRQKAGRAAS